MSTATATAMPVIVLAGQLAFKGDALGTPTRSAFYVVICILVLLPVIMSGKNR